MYLPVTMEFVGMDSSGVAITGSGGIFSRLRFRSLCNSRFSVHNPGDERGILSSSLGSSFSFSLGMLAYIRDNLGLWQTSFCSIHFSWPADSLSLSNMFAWEPVGRE